MNATDVAVAGNVVVARDWIGVSRSGDGVPLDLMLKKSSEMFAIGCDSMMLNDVDDGGTTAIGRFFIDKLSGSLCSIIR